MQRRSLLKLGALRAGVAVAQAAGAQRISADTEPVRRVLLVTKCHLDVGFTQTQQRVIDRYFQVHYPQAIQTAAELRSRGEDRYIWTTGSWLLYEYLEQAGPAERRVMERAIAAGDITWHALPFSWQSELLTSSLIIGALGFSAILDQRFDRKTIGAKMTDVPGHTRGLIAPLHARGIRFLDIGINAASTPPDVPDLFLWKDSARKSLAVMYHRHDYGSVVRIPGTDIAVAVEVRGDNSGPHTPQEIAAIYARLRAQFPEANITASTLNEVAAAVDVVRDRLPVVSSEIGDTWIYGVASDPVKMAQFREATRVRQQGLDQGRFSVADPTDRKFLRRFLLGAEHTWGTDTKTFLDNTHYRHSDLEKVLREPGYDTMIRSWKEKRDNIAVAAASLPEPLRKELKVRLEGLVPVRPARKQMRSIDGSSIVETRHFRLLIDGRTGAISRLHNRSTKREWASPSNPLALFTYQTLSAEDYADFLNRYVKSKADWAPRDFGKPGIELLGAASQQWHPRLLSGSIEHSKAEDRILLQWTIEDKAAENSGNIAWPKELFCDLRLPTASPRIEATVSTFGKPINRLPEAMWLTFNPKTRPEGTWSAGKVDESVRFNDVVQGGGRAMHAIADRIRYSDGPGEMFELQTLDAPLVAVSGKSPLNFSLAKPNLSGGIHVGLYNNAWGTNYPQWAGGDWQYRFNIVAS